MAYHNDALLYLVGFGEYAAYEEVECLCRPFGPFDKIVIKSTIKDGMCAIVRFMHREQVH